MSSFLHPLFAYSKSKMALETMNYTQAIIPLVFAVWNSPPKLTKFPKMAIFATSENLVFCDCRSFSDFCDSAYDYIERVFIPDHKSGDFNRKTRKTFWFLRLRRCFWHNLRFRFPISDSHRVFYTPSNNDRDIWNYTRQCCVTSQKKAAKETTLRPDIFLFFSVEIRALTIELHDTIPLIG